MAGTVRDFKNMVLQRAGVEDDFSGNSLKRMEFWQKLNRMGGRRIRELPPEQVPDIDATVVLSDQEWNELERELNSLL